MTLLTESKTPEEVFEDKYKEILTNEKGGFDQEQMKKELYDFELLQDMYTRVINAVSSFSKSDTDPEAVVSSFEENYFPKEWIADEIKTILDKDDLEDEEKLKAFEDLAVSFERN